MPLEPIEEKDLDLETKFKPAEMAGHAEPAGVPEAEKGPAKESVSAEKDNAYNKILSKVQSHQAGNVQSASVSDDAKSVGEKQDAESQITHLVEIATQKGVVHAVKVARHLESNYILDSFHDRLLSDELHQALLKKGLIKEL